MENQRTGKVCWLCIYGRFYEWKSKHYDEVTNILKIIMPPDEYKEYINSIGHVDRFFEGFCLQEVMHLPYIQVGYKDKVAGNREITYRGFTGVLTEVLDHFQKEEIDIDELKASMDVEMMKFIQDSPRIRIKNEVVLNKWLKSAHDYIMKVLQMKVWYTLNKHQFIPTNRFFTCDNFEPNLDRIDAVKNHHPMTAKLYQSLFKSMDIDIQISPRQTSLIERLREEVAEDNDKT